MPLALHSLPESLPFWPNVASGRRIPPWPLPSAPLWCMAFAWLMVWVAGAQSQLSTIAPKTWLFLVLSGFATGASWLCYFRALQLGSINQVVPVDKSSVIVTILLAFLLLHRGNHPGKGCRRGSHCRRDLWDAGAEAHRIRPSPVPGWSLASLRHRLRPVCKSHTILGKIGISGVESNLGTAIRTGVVLLMAWIMVFAAGKQHTIREIPRRELTFICLSGLATGGSWLCYYKALQDGPASVVVPIDKLSLLVTVAFSHFVFHEDLSKKAALGLAAMVAGTLVMLLP